VGKKTGSRSRENKLSSQYPTEREKEQCHFIRLHYTKLAPWFFFFFAMDTIWSQRLGSILIQEIPCPWSCVSSWKPCGARILLVRCNIEFIRKAHFSSSMRFGRGLTIIESTLGCTCRTNHGNTRFTLVSTGSIASCKWENNSFYYITWGNGLKFFPLKSNS